jgi:hypothetical protein
MRSLVRHSVQRVLGLKRTFWNKILPWGAIFIAYVPAIAFVGIAALLKERFERNGVDINQVIPTYPEFYLFVWAAIQVFAALAAPESSAPTAGQACSGSTWPPARPRHLPDRQGRRRRSRAVARDARAPAVHADRPHRRRGGPDGFTAFLGCCGGWSSAASSSPPCPRRCRWPSPARPPSGRASAAFILVTIGSAVIAETLVNAGPSPALFVNLYLPRARRTAHGEARVHLDPATNTSTAALVVAYLVITLGCAVFVRFRYQSIRVSR